MAAPITNIQAVEQKARAHEVVQGVKSHLYNVTSCSSNKTYTVNLITLRCTCPRDQFISQRNGLVNACSHVVAAKRFAEAQHGYSVKAHSSSMNVVHHHRRTDTALASDGVQLTARKVG